MKISRHLKNILIIIVIAGAIGGIGNYYMLPQGAKGFTLLRSVILGIIAAGVLPLFLKLISSSLLDTDGLSLPYKNYIVLISFCLLTGVFADLFLQGMYRKVFHEFEEKIEKQEKQLATTNTKSEILLRGFQYQSTKLNTTLSKQSKTASIQYYNLNTNSDTKELNALKKNYNLTTKEAEFFQKIKKSSILIKQKNELNVVDKNSLQKLRQEKLIDTKEFNGEIWLSERGIINNN